MKIALVYDRVNKWGGAERVLLTLHKIWPEAPLYTAVYDKKRAPWADVFDIRPSFLGNLPHEFLPWITPMAFESFNFDEFDVVISITSAEAKSIITKPQTIHICYCLTPTRYLWSSAREYERSGFSGELLRIMSSTLKSWDLVASSRPDYYVAISNRVKERIKKYYHRQVLDILYPPVEMQKFSRKKQGGSYFLTVSRLVGYKRIDILIRAFNKLGLPLVIIGDGRLKAQLQQIAKVNIRFIDRHLTDSELARYYEECRAFVYAADEDFGIAAAEAQAAGRPVIAYKKSGVSEIVNDGVTGILFDKQKPKSVMQAVKKFESMTFSVSACRRQVEYLSEKHFIDKMRALVQRLHTS